MKPPLPWLLLALTVAEVAVGRAHADQFEPVRELIRRTFWVELQRAKPTSQKARDEVYQRHGLVTVYHFTEVLKQPFRIMIRRGDREVFVYEPMKSDLVRRRTGQMKRFYQGG